MQITSLLDIVDGKLLNSPSISFVYSIKTNAKKVKEGDLFIAKNLEDIETAVLNGAFAILIQENHIILDNEIAWIKVDDLNLSIVKLIRFKLALKNLEAYSCNKIIFDLLKIYSSNLPKYIKLIPNKLESIFKHIDEFEDKDIIISNNQKILNDIYPKNKILEENIPPFKIDNLIEHSLFETSFSNDGLYFSRIKVSSLYIQDFLLIYKFLNKSLDLNRLKSFDNLKPIFLDKNLNVIEFGKSDRFIVCQDKSDLYEKEINYIKQKYKYAKTVFITLSKIDILDENEQILLKDLEDLKSILKNMKFNCLYLIGFNFNETYNYFIKSENSAALW